MKRRKLKNWVVYSAYAFLFIALIGTLYILESKNKSALKKPVYVEDTIIENNIPVINDVETISRPYTAGNVSIARTYYDYQDNEDNQVNSLIYYENTYLPNSGVDYKSEEVFDVVSILSGVVTKIEESNILGNIIEITHENNLISVYQSLSEINVAVDDQVLKGQVIGKSGNSNIDTNMGNHLHFEIIHDGTNVNPELYFDKKVNEL